MQTNVLIETIDTHTAGEPTRIVTGGIGPDALRGDTVLERRDRFERTSDDLRRLLMCEPRGHDDMFGAVPVEPAAPEADLGLFFFDGGGYLEMCGHGTIGTITALIETGQLPPSPEVVVETPAGLVHARPTVSGGHVERVEFENVESFVYDSLTVRLSGTRPPVADGGRGDASRSEDGASDDASLGEDGASDDASLGEDGASDDAIRGEELTIPVDVVFAGNVFALVDVTTLGLAVEPGSIDALVDLGLSIRRAVNEDRSIVDPFTGDRRPVSIVEFYDPSRDPDRNLVVFGDGQVDRSPCGTGTCAKMTLLHEAGELDVGERYRYESVIGTRFTGRLLGADRRDGHTVTRPTVGGQAYITGRHTFLRDDRDDLGGFSLG